MSEYWQRVPASSVQIVFESVIEYGPLAGDLERTALPFSVREFEIAAQPVSNTVFSDFASASDGWSNDAWWRFHLDALLQRRARPKTSGTQGDDAPVTQLSYWDALAFCHWLSWREVAAIGLPREAEYQAAVDHALIDPAGAGVLEWCRQDRRIPTATLPLRRGAERTERIGLSTQADVGFRLARYPQGDYAPFRFEPDAARIAELTEALPRERSFTQRCKMIDELGLLKATDAIDSLIALLTSTSTEDQAPHGYRPWIVREAAAQALGSIGDARAIPALLTACRHEDLSVSFLAGRSLGRLGRPAYEAAAGLLAEPSEKLRRLGATALAVIGDTRAISLLEPLAQTDPVESVRKTAQTSIDQLRA